MITGFWTFYRAKNRFCYSNKRECKVQVTQKNLILETIHSGVLSDEIIQVEVDKGSMKTKLKLRKITYYDRGTKEPSSLLAIYLNFEPTR
jgi:hypothetical protein